MSQTVERVRLSRQRRQKVPNIKIVEVMFFAPYYTVETNLRLAVCGSCAPLGAWDPENALMMRRTARLGWWRASTHMRLNEYYEWKLIVYDTHKRKVVRWEERAENRWDWLDRGPIKVVAHWNESEIRCCLLVECETSPCHCLTPFTALELDRHDLVNITFITHYNYTSDDEVLAVSGSGKYLGHWDTRFARQFERALPEKERLSVTIKVPPGFTGYWKLVLIHKRYRTPIRWEDHGNRYVSTKFREKETESHRVTIGANWNQDAYRVCNSYLCLRKRLSFTRRFIISDVSRAEKTLMLTTQTQLAKFGVGKLAIGQ